MEQKTKETRVSYTLDITSEGSVQNVSFELPKYTKFVKGIQLLSNEPSKLFYRGSQRIEIGGEELFPDGFQSRLLMSTLSVAPKERFFELGEVLPKDLLIKVRFEDSPNTNVDFENGYNCTLVFLLEEQLK